jgi:hypothetical protein
MMQLISLNSVQAMAEPDVYKANITAEIDLMEQTVDYISRGTDPYGLGPAVWAAVQEWIADGNTVDPA